ncbi:MAG: F0F1 ATP synthase subunit delta [Treponema sp.]|jgi:F-type H+-transporting ATPase subunit delta|nr:F0F1 ATP synthase subunit delta [Treponema sp.]
MFSGDRWAAAFIGSCGLYAEEGLRALQSLVPVIGGIPGNLAGSASAQALEGIIRKALAQSGAANPGLEQAVRLILLLVKKGCFTHAPQLMAAIEALLDRQKGVLQVTVEAAVPVDPVFQKKLDAALIESWVAAENPPHTMTVKEIKMMVQIVPELLGGYRLRIGSERVDASLRAQLRRMAQDLQALPCFSKEPRDVRGSVAAGGVSW